MNHRALCIGAVSAALASFPALASAAETAEATPAAAPSLNYLALTAGTTVAHRAPGHRMAGMQNDVSPMIGVGRTIATNVALELDAGPTVQGGGVTSFSFEPSVIWAFSSYVYAAARFVVPVEPTVDIAASPGLGVTYALPNGMSPSLEANAISYFGAEKPDFGVGVTVGMSYAF